MKPQNTGLVTLHDDKEDRSGFFCLKLVEFLNEEAEMGTERYAGLWEQRFDQAKAGACANRESCPIYGRTAKRIGAIQLSLF
jgi:hypothetical protein